jgi:hypothetical protein
MAYEFRKQPPDNVPLPRPTHVQFFVDVDGVPKLKLPNGSVVAAVASGNPVPLNELGAAPAPVANVAQLYSKQVLGITEFFVIDDTGQEVQVTNNGGLNLPTSLVFNIDATFQTTTAASASLATYTPDTNSRSVVIWGIVQARETTLAPAEVKVWGFTAVGDRDAGGVVTALLLDIHNGPQASIPANSATWTLSFTDDGTSLFLTIVGQAGKTIDWRATAWAKETV